MSDLHERPAHAIADAIRNRELSSVEVLEHFLARIERIEPDLNAICDLDTDGAREQARAIDARVGRGEDPGPWAGVPMGV